MPRQVRSVSVPRSYAALRTAVEQVVVAGRSTIERAWVQTYHETGRLIAEHVLLHRERGDYGAKTIARLAGDLQISKRTLHECVQFHRCFPIVRVRAQLSWQHYRLLCQVADPAVRGELLTELERNGGSSIELEARVRALNAAHAADGNGGETLPVSEPARRRLKPRRGSAGLYRLVHRDGALAVDVGFKFYVPLGGRWGAPPRGAEAGAIVRERDGEFALEREATGADLFTYRATVRRVIDGDTLAVTLALPHGEMDEKLRLRGLDCPELDTAAGKAAKRFVETLLTTAAEVTIATSKVDKYDRYLADVFVRRAEGGDVFLNGALLESRHAEPMGNEAMEEWVP